MNIHYSLFALGIMLILIEVYFGVALGFCLAAAVTCFLLGILEWIGLLTTITELVIAGSIILPLCIFAIIKLFKNSVRSYENDYDVNNY
jgi:hypothetical protein